MIKSCVTVIVSGNIDGYLDIEEKMNKIFSKYDNNDIKVQDLKYNNNQDKDFEYEEVKEYQDTTQSVLSMGLRIKDCNEQDFYALNLYNAILGVTPSSKLFQNVREKESLAYTVRSRYYRFKNILVIFAGINKENYEKAVLVIKEQLEDMRQGKITDDEFTSAKDSLLADLLEWNDSKIAMEKMKLSNLIAFKDENITIEIMRNKIKDISMSGVIEVANKVQLEKIFILGGEDNA